MRVYCGQGHPSSSCSTVIDIAVRKEILQKAGRCYTCLKRHHLSKNCRSRLRCESCQGRHHVTICSRNVGQNTNPSSPRPNTTSRVSSEGFEGRTPPNKQFLLHECQISCSTSDSTTAVVQPTLSRHLLHSGQSNSG